MEAVVRAQKRMLQRFEKTNEMLANCNTLSATRLERATRDFKARTDTTSDSSSHFEKHIRPKFVCSKKENIRGQGCIMLVRLWW